MRIGWFNFGTPLWWRYMWRERQFFGIFRNRPYIQGRWGFYFLGFEFGSRHPGNRTGIWLKKHGLWPW